MKEFLPYAGVSLVHHPEVGSILFGAPSDSFKAVKALCNQNALPFPRILVAPPRLMIDSVAQFAPEFFLYDFLFVYGAAFKPELREQRLLIVAPRHIQDGLALSLRHTLLGPTEEELHAYAETSGAGGLDAQTIADLVGQSKHLAIKRDGRISGVDDMVRFLSLDNRPAVLSESCSVSLDEDGFLVTAGPQKQYVRHALARQVEPFASLQAPQEVVRPQTFGIQALGTRSGFDLSGPTTGFALSIAGRLVLYDGPPAVEKLLQTQGMSLRDVEAVIVSHCHEDHMASVIELLMRSERPKLITSEPIYRSLLVKLSAYFRQPQSEVAKLINYAPVAPGEPFALLGATFEFFYTAHSIPTLGVKVTMLRHGQQYEIQISGDTIHHKGLDEMLASQAIGAKHHAAMRHMVPQARQSNAIYLVDAGGMPIHGLPQDWAGNPNKIFYYHCPDNVDRCGTGHEVMRPGRLHVWCQAPRHTGDTAASLVDALAFAQLNDARWLSILMHLGDYHQLNAGDALAPDACAPLACGVVVSGALALDGNAATLAAGDVYGSMFAHHVTPGGHRAAGPTEVLCWSEKTFASLTDKDGVGLACRQQQRFRRIVDRSRLFGSVPAAAKNRLCVAASLCQAEEGATFLNDEKPSDDLYVSVSGSWTATQANWPQPISVPSVDFLFFNEALVLNPQACAKPTIVADVAATCLRLEGAAVRHLAQHFSGLRLELQRAIRLRQGLEAGMSENT